MQETYNDAKSIIKKFITKNFLLNSDHISFSDTDSFVEKGIIDSTGILELVSFIQQAFGLTLQDEDIIPENLDSIEKISAFIQRKNTLAS